jgi:hypothetical protein
MVYHKMAKGKEPPIRIIEGDHTRLEDPHGIALDTKNKIDVHFEPWFGELQQRG